VQVTALIDKYFEKEVEADEGLIGAVKTIPPSTRASIKVPSWAADDAHSKQTHLVRHTRTVHPITTPLGSGCYTLEPMEPWHHDDVYKV
jgi:hypothetical protein